MYKTLKILLKLSSGVFGECDSEYDQREEAIKNGFLLYQNGVFHYFVDELNTEYSSEFHLLEYLILSRYRVINASNSSSMRKPAVSLADSVHIRLI